MTNAFLSIAMIAGFLLVLGAWLQWRRSGFGKQTWLLMVAAAILFANVAIWVVPDRAGNSLATRTDKRP